MEIRSHRYWKSVLDGDRMKPCKHFPSRDGCRVCWLYEHDARYRTFWGGDPDTTTTEIVTTGATPPPNRGAQPTDEQMAMLRKIKLHMASPCQHLGAALEEKPSCGCGGSLAILHSCSLHSQCRISSRDTAVRNCIACDDYTPRVENV